MYIYVEGDKHLRVSLDLFINFDNFLVTRVRKYVIFLDTVLNMFV